MTIFIKTAADEKIAVQVLYPDKKQRKLVFLEHGLAGFKEEGMMQTAAQAFLARGYTVVLFDARFGLGQSDGALAQANFTHFIEDLETVIAWGKTQDFYMAPFALCGHSLGAGSCLHYAVRHLAEVSYIISLSAVVSGKLLLESYLNHKPQFVKQWQQERLIYKERPDDKTKNGFISYDHMEEALRYDLIQETPRLTCPILVVCGDRDISSTIEINTMLYDSLTGCKKMTILKDCGHTYQTEQNKADLYNSIFDWLKSF